MTQQTTTFRLPARKTKTVARLAPTGMTVGTAVMTMEGERYVEDLKPGDRVLTKDFGAQQIKRIGFRDIDLSDAPDRAPVLIHAGAFGKQLPSRPLFLAPDQRIALRHRMFDLFFGVREVMISARDLVGRNGIKQVEGLKSVTYIALAFARHQLLYCGNLAVDLGLFAGVDTRPGLSASDAKVALGVMSGRPMQVPQSRAALH